VHSVNTPKLYNRSQARASIMGHEPTMNPTPAAAMLLGMTVQRPIGHRSSVAKRSILKRRHPRTANPTPAALVSSVVPGGSLITSLLGGLGKRFKAPSEKRAAGLAPAIVASANAGNLTAARGLLERAAKPMKVAESLVWKAAAAQLSQTIVAAVQKHLANIPQADQSGPEQFAQSVVASAYQAPGVGAAAPSAAAQLLGVLGQPGTVRALASAAKPRASRRQRYPTYVDRYGRQKYSTRPPEMGEMRLPAGATPAPGTPYSFFQGKVGGGSAAQTAGQLALVAAAGTAAYLGTQAILKHFAGGNVAPEQAGVALALAARDARKEYALTHNLRGPAPSYGVPAAVIKQIHDGQVAKLRELGYNEHGVRVRSASERFLSTYGEGE